jgi:FtsH-binding integral membrane protein
MRRPFAQPQPTTPSGSFDFASDGPLGPVLSHATPAERATFFRRTYGLVAAAFAAFGGLLGLFFIGFDAGHGIAFSLFKGLAGMMSGLGNWSVLLVMLAFWGGSSLAQSLAFHRTSRARQYTGLSLFVVLEALLFVPLIGFIVLSTRGDASSILLPAGIVTGAMILGLTAVVFLTDLDFSVLRAVVVIGGIAAIAIAVIAAITDQSLGIWFSIAMIALMATTILYQTHAIRGSFGTQQHVSAAFLLFSSFVTLFFYVLRFFSQRE